MNRYSISLLLSALLGAAPSLQAAELGRLFYTPQERLQLEYQGASNNTEDTGSARSGTIIVNGVVQKQGGNRIVWINGQAQAVGRGSDKTPESVSVTVPGKSQPVQVKVGQRLLVDAPSAEDKP